jgi:undecaprenyl-diphosphatase
MNMTMSQTLFLGALQGVAELFPISSLAQIILLPDMLGWNLDEKNKDFLAFTVALHLATATALVIYFWRDWWAVLLAYAGSFKRRQLVYDEQSKFAWLLVAGTIVVGLVGLIFEKKLRVLFEEKRWAWVVAVVLVLNGFMMLGADALKRRASSAEDPDNKQGPHTADPSTDVASQRKSAHEMTFIEGAAVGATQTLALIPGISRSGITIVAGLLAGLSYKEASRFSFMLATPVIGLAAILKVPTLFAPEARQVLVQTIPSAILAGVAAYLSTKFLMRYFQHHRLGPFGWFCIAFGLFALVMLRH